MLIPQLLFAHMLADYILQTNWLVARKGQAWDWLALHGLMVFAMSMLALARFAPIVLLPITILALLHTAQDWVKIHYGSRLKLPSIYSYMADQFSHYTMIGVTQVLIGPLLLPDAPTTGELIAAATGASVVILTRFYDVTWWSNWLDMLPYMARWRNLGYAERLTMFALTVAGLFYLAPLCILPRLFEGWRSKHPIWKERRGLWEIGLGVVLSVFVGLLVRSLLPASLR